MPLRVLRFALFLVAFGLLAWLWGEYGSLSSITYYLRRRLGDALPIYAQTLPADLGDPDVIRRLGIALLITFASVATCIVAAALRWRTWICLALACVGAFATNASVAQIRGERWLTAPYARRGLEYFQDVPRVNDAPLRFISNYPAISPTLSHHAGTHPPGGVLFLWVGSKLFGESIEAAAWWSIGFGALGVVPTYWLARLTIGAARARRVLPLYLVTPSLVLFGATSMDIVFLVFSTAALAGLFWAMRRLTVTRVLVAGGLYWLAAFMTFAVIALPVLAGTFALLTAVRRRRVALRMLGRLALVGLAFVFFEGLAELFLGYDFLQAADAAVRRDHRGMGMTGYENYDLWKGLSLANLAGFAIGTGIALSAGAIASALTLPFQRRMLLRPLPKLALAVPICLVALAVSTLFSLETERVWIGIVPAMLCVSAGTRGGLSGWLLIGLLGVQTFLTECRLYTHW